MKRLPVLAAVVLLAASCSDSQAPSPTAPGASLAVRNGADNAPIYIVMLHEDVTDVSSVVAGIARAKGLSPRFVWQAVKGFSAAIPPARVDAIRSDPRVKLVEPDRPISLIKPIVGPKAPRWCSDPANADHPACSEDDGSTGGGGGQITPWGVERVGGPDDGSDKTAWVIDTGVDLDHPDLNVDTSCSANFVTRGKKSPDDGHGHGTHVAGTIGALNNTTGVVGVAAGARICAVRVLDNSGSGYWEWVINGVNFVAENGSSGDVANMSLGGSASGSEPNSIELAILAAAGNGILFSIAAGNSGDDASNHTPARIGDNSTRVYTISATNSDNCLPGWSNWGDPVDNAEPGVSILSTAKGGGTTTMSGTSMAAPHAAGILLLGVIKNGGAACNDPAPPADEIGILP